MPTPPDDTEDKPFPPPALPSDPYARPVDGTPDSNEMFYINANGEKDDTGLHERTIREADWPIDESIMGPIRAKYRKRAGKK